MRGDFVHNYDKMGTMKTELERKKKNSSALEATFGSPFSKYFKSVVPGAPHLSKSPKDQNKQMFGLVERDRAFNATKPNRGKLPLQTSDRGLKVRTKQQRENTKLGPGTHSHS